MHDFSSSAAARAVDTASGFTTRPDAPVRRFSPAHHREAILEGLAGSFAAEEIACIYASSWERDFSQGSPDLASAAIAWAAVKNHAVKHGGAPGPAAATFQAAVWKIVNDAILDASDESLGEYSYWEHMDRPGFMAAAGAEHVWAQKSEGLAGYLADAKAYLQDHLVAAIDLYRQINHLDPVGGRIDNWKGVLVHPAYVAPVVTREGGRVVTALPANFDDENVASRDPIREATTRAAAAAGARTDPAHDAERWKLIGQHLGRAMHAFQDFWASSNWLELAQEAKAVVAAGGWALGGRAGNRRLKAGTFGLAAQAHALGHKLVAFATSLQEDFALLLEVYGRAEASAKIDSKEAKSGLSTVWGGNGMMAFNDHQLAYGALRADAWSTVDEIADVSDAVDHVEELILTGRYEITDFLCNRRWLQAVADKGHKLLARGDERLDGDAHGELAEDPPECEDHEFSSTALALALAKQATRLVFAPVRAIMEEEDAAKALEALRQQLDLIDAMIAAPTPVHPLWALVPAR